MPVNKGFSAVFVLNYKNSFRKKGVYMLRPHSELVKGQSPDNTPFSSGKEKIFFRFLSKVSN